MCFDACGPKRSARRSRRSTFGTAGHPGALFTGFVVHQPLDGASSPASVSASVSQPAADAEDGGVFVSYRSVAGSATSQGEHQSISSVAGVGAELQVNIQVCCSSLHARTFTDCTRISASSGTSCVLIYASISFQPGRRECGFRGVGRSDDVAGNTSRSHRSRDQQRPSCSTFFTFAHRLVLLLTVRIRQDGRDGLPVIFPYAVAPQVTADAAGSSSSAPHQSSVAGTTIPTQALNLAAPVVSVIRAMEVLIVRVVAAI